MGLPTFGASGAMVVREGLRSLACDELEERLLRVDEFLVEMERLLLLEVDVEFKLRALDTLPTLTSSQEVFPSSFEARRCKLLVLLIRL
jgi:hypothetical protein